MFLSIIALEDTEPEDLYSDGLQRLYYVLRLLESAGTESHFHTYGIGVMIARLIYRGDEDHSTLATLKSSGILNCNLDSRIDIGMIWIYQLASDISVSM